MWFSASSSVIFCIAPSTAPPDLPRNGGSSRRRTRREKRAEKKRTAFHDEDGGEPASRLRVDAGSGLTAAFLRKYAKQRTDDDVRAERQRDERRAQRLQTIGSVLKSSVSFVVLLWIVLQTLGILGVNVAPFIASAGIVGVALGFGAQALVRTSCPACSCCSRISTESATADLGEASGTVETVGLRVTTVRDLHGTLWYCRNGEIMRVGNYSQDFGVALLEFPISYRADVDRACAIALETATAAAAEEPMKSEVLSAPELQGVNQLGPDSWTMRMTVVTRANAQWATERELRRRIRKAFDDAGIESALPGRHAGLDVGRCDGALARDVT